MTSYRTENTLNMWNPKSKVARSLGRLMPNLRGPKETKRKLYANVVLSILLYAAPVWCDALTSSRRGREKLDRIMKVTNLRVTSAYRTVSLEAASILARIPPLHLLAAERRRVYLRTKDLRDGGEGNNEEAMKEIRESEALITRRQWEIYIQRPLFAGTRTRDAVLPHFAEWLDRKHGGITFHLTQLLTGHGCFASFLYRIGKVDSPVCEHCADNKIDTAEHTLQECNEWTAERDALKEIIGDDLDMGSVIGAVCRERAARGALTRFAETVMLRKEDRERARQAHEALVTSPETSAEESTASSNPTE